MRTSPRRPLTAFQQLWALRGRWGGATGSIGRNRFQWEGSFRPTPLSRDYRLRVSYRDSSVPDVWVLDPDLTVLAEGRRLQHVYEQRPPRLCLHIPKAGEWTSHLLIADTIVPWAVLWLFYFEDWLVTDIWAGGGVHPDQQG